SRQVPVRRQSDSELLVVAVQRSALCIGDQRRAVIMLIRNLINPSRPTSTLRFLRDASCVVGPKLEQDKKASEERRPHARGQVPAYEPRGKTSWGIARSGRELRETDDLAQRAVQLLHHLCGLLPRKSNIQVMCGGAKKARF